MVRVLREQLAVPPGLDCPAPGSRSLQGIAVLGEELEVEGVGVLPRPRLPQRLEDRVGDDLVDPATVARVLPQPRALDVMVLPDWRVSGPPLVGLERLSLRHTNRLCVEVDRPDHLDVPRAPGFEGAQIAAERLPAGALSVCRLSSLRRAETRFSHSLVSFRDDIAALLRS
jgi:hypothetical protein